MNYFPCAIILHYIKYKNIKIDYYIFNVDSLHQTWKLAFLSLLVSVAKYRCKMIAQFAKIIEKSF